MAGRSNTLVNRMHGIQMVVVGQPTPRTLALARVKALSMLGNSGATPPSLTLRDGYMMSFTALGSGVLRCVVQPVLRRLVDGPALYDFYTKRKFDVHPQTGLQRLVGFYVWGGKPTTQNRPFIPYIPPSPGVPAEYKTTGTFTVTSFSHNYSGDVCQGTLGGASDPTERTTYTWTFPGNSLGTVTVTIGGKSNSGFHNVEIDKTVGDYYALGEEETKNGDYLRLYDRFTYDGSVDALDPTWCNFVGVAYCHVNGNNETILTHPWRSAGASAYWDYTNYVAPSYGQVGGSAYVAVHYGSYITWYGANGGVIGGESASTGDPRFSKENIDAFYITHVDQWGSRYSYDLALQRTLYYYDYLTNTWYDKGRMSQGSAEREVGGPLEGGPPGASAPLRLDGTTPVSGVVGGGGLFYSDYTEIFYGGTTTGDDGGVTGRVWHRMSGTDLWV